MDPERGGCEHDWWPSRMVLDGRGTLIEDVCRTCGALAVEPASGDRREVPDRPHGK